MRQLRSSATKSSFSLGQAISWIQPNWPSCLPDLPRTPRTFPGRIYKLTLDGKVLGVLGKSGKQLGQFGWIHEIACPNENELFVAELLNWRIQKLDLEPTR